MFIPFSTALLDELNAIYLCQNAAVHQLYKLSTQTSVTFCCFRKLTHPFWCCSVTNLDINPCIWHIPGTGSLLMSRCSPHRIGADSSHGYLNLLTCPNLKLLTLMLFINLTSTQEASLPGSTQKENMSSRWAAMFFTRPFPFQPWLSRFISGLRLQRPLWTEFRTAGAEWQI